MKQIFLSAFIFFSSLLFCQNTTGFNLQKNNSQQGYVLFAPLHSTTTYLIDKCGRQVHNWKSAYKPGQSVYLLPNEDLLRTAKDTTNVLKAGAELNDLTGTINLSGTIHFPTQQNVSTTIFVRFRTATFLYWFGKKNRSKTH